MGQQINPNLPLYNMIHAYRIMGEIDPVYFDQAFQKVVEGSDALRTVIRLEKDEPRQFADPEVKGTTGLLDFSAEPDPLAAYDDWIAKQKQSVFNLEKQMFESFLIKIQPDYWIWYLSQHHIITDAIATGLVYQATAEAYALAVQNNLDGPPTLPQFVDFVEWELNHKQTDRYKQALAHWEEKLEKEVPETQFYGKHVPETIGRANRNPVKLGMERSNRLREIAMEDGFAALSLDMSLFTLFATLLATTIHRVAGEDNIRIGTPYHGRPSAAFKKTIGVFIEVGVLQIDIEENDTFVSLGERILEETFSNMMQVQPGISTPKMNQSFPVMLNFINGISGGFAGHSVSTDWIHTGHFEANQAFRMQVTDFDQTGEFTCNFDLSAELFGPNETEWIKEQFLAVVDTLIADHTQAIGGFSLMSPSQHQTLFIDFNATDHPYPKEKTVIDLFKEQVGKTPDNIAAVRGQDTISYRELDERSTDLAHQLVKMGAAPEKTVALFMHRSIEALIGIWGVLKSGAAYVPIDTSFPADRRLAMITEPKAICVLSNTAELQATVEADVDVPVLLIDRHGDYAQDLGTLPTPPAPDNLAYIIFTSGSTGRPKGTLLTHQGLMNHIWWCKDAYLQGEVMDFPFNASFSFDSMIATLFLTPITGGKIQIYSEADYARGLEAVAIFQEDAVDFVKLTPSHMSLIADHVSGTERIKVLYSGGEELKTSLATRMKEKFGREIRLTNAYGPTEVVVACTLHEFDPEKDTGQAVPIGRPGYNMRLYLLDKYRQPVPPGVEGELYVSSDGVARGYLNRPELNAERFLDDPFRAGARMYKSGDMARWNEKGEIIFAGRKDNQVKIRGVRIELSGLETILQKHPDINLVVVDVITVTDSAFKDLDHDKKHLSVWYTSAKKLETADLRTWLADQIPDLMMPSFFTQLDEMPLTTSKKINRIALPEPAKSEFDANQAVEEPASDLEIQLAEAWKSNLNLPKIGINHNFFEIGGDSILAIQAIMQINREYDIEFPIPRFFDSPTIQDIALVIEEILLEEIDSMDEEEIMRLLSEESN